MLYINTGQRKNNSTEMKTLRLISISCQTRQLMLSACKQKDVAPNIDQLVGDYDCKFQWYGGWNIGPANAKSFRIIKSLKGGDKMLEVQMDIGGGWQETWQVEYIESLNGLLLMEKQVVRETQTTLGSIYDLQKGSGRVFGDSLRFEGERFIESGPSIVQTFSRYWAKKK
jgi:hypothetical protein